MDDASGLALVPFYRFNPHSLAKRLVKLVASQKGLLEVDFPAVPQRYADASRALWSVLGNIKGAFFGPRSFVPLVVTFNGEPIGVATLQQRQLRDVRSGQLLISGPLFAVWLGAYDVRPDGAKRPLLPEVLELLEQQIRRRRMRGRCWTLIRPEHSYVRGCLGHSFGGMYAPWRAGSYSHIDGVRAFRQVWIGTVLVR